MGAMFHQFSLFVAKLSDHNELTALEVDGKCSLPNDRSECHELNIIEEVLFKIKVLFC